ncbi:hypothetical protein LguiB_024601 [Lonicera macranthoides]
MELSSSSTGSSKRAKAPGNVGQVLVSCLVDGCNSDLSQCREYHRRHKVCEAHSKTPKVTIGGREQRFCQQCSRFHSLEEFDEGKRSCRKRLDGHNRRRRKPQSDSFPRSSGIFFSAPQGTRLLSFGGPQVLANPAVSSAWPGSIKAENESLLFTSSPMNYIEKQNSYPINSVPNTYKEMNRFQFIQGTDHIIPEVSSSVNNRMFCDGGINRAGNSDRALSLLSSAPTSQTRDMGSSHMVHHEPVPQAESFHEFGGVGQLFPYSSQEMESKGVVSDGESSGSRSNNNNNNNNNTSSTLHFQGMFHDGGPDGSSAGGGGSHQTLSFGW